MQRPQHAVVLIRRDIGDGVLCPGLTVNDLVQCNSHRWGEHHLCLFPGIHEADKPGANIFDHLVGGTGGGVGTATCVHCTGTGKGVHGLIDHFWLRESGCSVVKIDHTNTSFWGVLIKVAIVGKMARVSNRGNSAYPAIRVVEETSHKSSLQNLMVI